MVYILNFYFVHFLKCVYMGGKGGLHKLGKDIEAP